MALAPGPPRGTRTVACPAPSGPCGLTQMNSKLPLAPQGCLALVSPQKRPPCPSLVLSGAYAAGRIPMAMSTLAVPTHRHKSSTQ